MGEQTGLASLMESVRVALRGAGFDEVSRSAKRFREALAETMADPGTLGDRRIVEAYMARVVRAVELLAKALRLSGFSTDTAPLAAGIAAGLTLVDEDATCVLAVLRSSVELEGALYEAGDILCVEPMLAVALSSAGLMELVTTFQGPVTGEG